MAGVLGLDTSNYTTSAAWFDGTGGTTPESCWKYPREPLAFGKVRRCSSM